MQETAMALKTSPNIIEIVTDIQEEEIHSVLTSTLSYDQIEPAKLTVREDDAKQVNYFERIKNILTPNPSPSEAKLIDRHKSTPLFVPIIMNRNRIIDIDDIITKDNSSLSFDIPQSLVNNNFNPFGDDNPGSSIINAILGISTSTQKNNINNSNDNNKILIKKSTEFTSDMFHCKCCEKLKNICEHSDSKLFKWRSEPNLKCCDISNNSLNNSCLDTHHNKQTNLLNHFQNIVLPKCHNNLLNNSKKIASIDMVDSYTEIDMNRFTNNENLVKTVDKLALNVDNLKIGSSQLTQEIQKLKYGFQEENDRVSKLMKDAQQLVQDLKDLKYLDDLILMLEGQLDHIQMKPWPFKSMNLDNRGKNFIV